MKSLKSVFRILGISIAVLALSNCATNDSGSKRRAGVSGRAIIEEDNSLTASNEARKYYGEEITAAEEKELLAKNTVYFGFDRYDVTDDQKLIILAHAKKLADNPRLVLRIEGNTDARGSSEYNVALGERRARGVAKIMAMKGIPSSRLAVVSLGKERLVAYGSDEYSHQLNRRSEMHFEDRG